MGMFEAPGDKKSPPSQNGQQSSPDEAQCDGANEEHSIFAAVKSGLLDSVQKMAGEDPEVFVIRDKKGHAPAHWACLTGNAAVLRCIMDSKGPVDDPGTDDLGSHPIHWACVNGHVGIVDLLLQHGVSIDVADNKGCTPLIVAAQYGHTIMAGYLMGKGARLQMVDKDGDNALHWASFKGHTDLVCLLLYSGFNPVQRDNFGQTPLHLASISGSIAAVKEICKQDGVKIDLADNNGKTAMALASGRRHRDIYDYLKKAQKKSRIIPKIDFLTIAFGPSGNTKSAVLFLMVTVLCWGYPMYTFKCIPYTWNDLYLLHIAFFLVNVVMWVCLFHTSTTNPGYVPRNIPEYDQAIKQVAQYSEWKQGENPLSRLCHTCRTVKPWRSKHCSICNRCVLMFDHHCPYVYNCIGYNNRVSFVGFVTSFTLNGYLSIFLGVYTIHHYEAWYLSYIVGFLLGGAFTVMTSLMSAALILNVLDNLTTNDRLCYKKYPHMKDKEGKLFNPFDGGTKANVLDFFHIKHLPKDDAEDYIMIKSLSS